MIEVRKHNNKLFAGFGCVISSLDALEVEDECALPSKLMVSRSLGDQLKRMMSMHGCLISSNFVATTHYPHPHKLFPHLSSSFLLSDAPKRTEKYLLAMIYGTPCLHYQWAIDCMVKGRIIDYQTHRKYQLPYGEEVGGICVFGAGVAGRCSADVITLLLCCTFLLLPSLLRCCIE